jgi:hypothetical protein
MSINIPDITLPRSLQQNLPDSKINLKNGDVIRATVMGRLPEGGTLLLVNGKQLNLLTELNLPEGSKQLFQVTVTGSKIELRPLENPPLKPDPPALSISPNAARMNLTSVIQELVTALDQTELSRMAAQGAKDLKQIMASILYSDPGKNNGIWIKENILASGMLWESKVAELLSDENNNSIKRAMKGDLKAILLSLQKALHSENGDHADAVAMKVKQALNLIEGNQHINFSTLEDGLGWLFVIPGAEKDGFNKAEVFVKKRGESKGISFSVLAEFTQLGRFEADVSMMESRVSVRILMDDEKKSEIVNNNLSVLESGLKALGLNNIALSCYIRKATDIPGGLDRIYPVRLQPVNIVI